MGDRKNLGDFIEQIVGFSALKRLIISQDCKYPYHILTAKYNFLGRCWLLIEDTDRQFRSGLICERQIENGGDFIE